MSVSGYIELTDWNDDKVLVSIDHLSIVANVKEVVCINVVGHNKQFAVKESYEDIRGRLDAVIRGKVHNPPPPPPAPPSLQNREVKYPY